MRITRLIQVASLGAILALGSTAVYAKGHASHQTHHCQLADGSTDSSKTHKQCTAAKGTWAKDAATADSTQAKSAEAAPTAPVESAAPAAADGTSSPSTAPTPTTQN